MTLSSKTLEQLISERDSMFKTIIDLEIGLRSEKKKIDEFEFYLNDKNFDALAMEAQILRSKLNVKSIQHVLKLEKEKLDLLNKEIDAANELLNNHGIKPCLLGTISHSWDVLARHPSGKFSHRKCRVCGTSEKVGNV